MVNDRDTLQKSNMEMQQEISRLQKNTEYLSLMVDTARLLASSKDLSLILQSLSDVSEQIIGFGTAAVYIRYGDRIILEATTPPLPPDLPVDLRSADLKDHLHIKRVIDEKTTVVVPDAEVEDFTEAERIVAENRNLNTIVYFPLIGRRGCIGTFIVSSTKKNQVISDVQNGYCEMLGKQAAIAIENTRLFNSLESELENRRKSEKEREEILKQLYQAQKMESVGRLAGGVAHDFNNMLQGILGYTEITASLIDDEEALENLKEIDRIASRSANLAKQLLGYARKQSVTRGNLDINHEISQILRMLRRVIGENIRLLWKPEVLDATVFMDPSQLEQIITNLVVNARDAIGETGTIDISTSGITLDEEEDNFKAMDVLPGNYIMIQVYDSGCGMSRETLQKIFEPFYTTKEVGKGTGLGLATVYGIVKQNNGAIYAYSEPGNGSIFKIYLPCSPDQETDSAPAETDSKTAPAGSERILFVEDEEAILKTNSFLLEKQGYKVVQATLPSQALAAYEENMGEFDLIISDLIMPEMTGLELVEKIKVHNARIKYIFISGYSTEILKVQHCHDEDCHFISKPFRFRDLSEKIREVLDISM